MKKAKDTQKFAKLLKQAIDRIHINQGQMSRPQIREELGQASRQNGKDATIQFWCRGNIPKRQPLEQLTAKIVQMNGFNYEQAYEFLSVANYPEISQFLLKLFPILTSQQKRSKAETVDTRLLENREELFTYSSARIKEAQYSIYVTLSTNSTPDSNRPISTAYYDEMTRLIKSNKLLIKRIVVVNTVEQLDWVKEMLHEFASCKFQLACYERQIPQIPVPDFMIIDSEEIILSIGSINKTQALSIMNTQFVNLMRDHFDSLWKRALQIKSDYGINYEYLQRLEAAIRDRNG